MLIWERFFLISRISRRLYRKDARFSEMKMRPSLRKARELKDKDPGPKGSALVHPGGVMFAGMKPVE